MPIGPSGEGKIRGVSRSGRGRGGLHRAEGAASEQSGAADVEIRKEARH
jgi:hypothetical protein